MITKDRKIKDSKTKDKLGLSTLMTRIQKETLEQVLNGELDGCRIYDPRNGCLYKRGMTPCSLNDIGKSINKKVDKLFRKLEQLGLIKQVVDLKGQHVWMVNPDLYWDYVGWELYYNRWLFSCGSHRQASEIVNLSLYYGYYYNTIDNSPIKKIPKSHWQRMAKWWLLIDNESSLDLLGFEQYQPCNIYG